MKEYKICNMRVAKDGAKIGGYIIKRVPEYKERRKGLYKPERVIEKESILFVNSKNKNQIRKHTNEGEKFIEPMQYGSHQVTAIATPMEEEKDSIFSKNKKGIYDICLLYNFFTGQNSCLEEDVDRFTHRNKIGTELDKEFNVSCLILEVLKEINNEEWRTDKKDKEILAFLFLLDGRNPKGLQLSFIEKWMCLEILGIHSRKTQLFDIFKKEIKLFNEIDFKYCLKIIRNNYVHEGKCNLRFFKKGLNYYIKKKKPISNKFKKFINFRQKDKFSQFKKDTWEVMDYLLSRIFVEIFGITDKIGKINTYYFKKVNNYFRKIYN